jgi:ribosome biogenesis protein Tsr3
MLCLHIVSDQKKYALLMKTFTEGVTFLKLSRSKTLQNYSH